VEGIVIARISEQEQTLDDARENLSACAQLAAPSRMPLLVDIRAARPLTPEVRHHYTGDVLVSFGALAMLVNTTPLGRMMGNVYLRIARLAIPTQIFAEEPAALAWLRKRRG
jgi:hypothetical protein